MIKQVLKKGLILAFVFPAFLLAQENSKAKDSLGLPLEIKGELKEANGSPIPYATIQYGDEKGVISNDEGRFRFLLDQFPKETDSLKITCMGFESKTMPLQGFRDSSIVLSSKTIDLKGVYVFDNPLTVEEIIEKVQENIPTNYKNDSHKTRFFLRQSNFNTVDKMDITFKKSSIKELNKELLDSVLNLIPRSAAYYTETLGDVYRHKSGLKMDVVRAAELYDKSNNGSLEAMGERLEAIFKENVKPDSYLKIKSGIFGTKMQLDSILEESDEAAEVGEDIKEEVKEPESTFFHKRMRGLWDDIEQDHFYQEDSKLNVFEKSRKYNFTLDGYADIAGEGTYVISFEPKRSADFKGRLFVNIEDYAVMRIEYENVQLLRNFRLLGITYKERIYRGVTSFRKSRSGIYRLAFLEKEVGNQFGIDRPLKVVEKNKNVRGRRKQNELLLHLDIANGSRDKYELVVYDEDELSAANFESFTEKKNVKATYLKAYDPSFWEGYSTMEPNSALRQFTVEEGK